MSYAFATLPFFRLIRLIGCALLVATFQAVAVAQITSVPEGDWDDLPVAVARPTPICLPIASCLRDPETGECVSLPCVGVPEIPPTPVGAAPLIISEYRLRGPGNTLNLLAESDEFVEIYNNSDQSHTVSAADGSTGYALVASDGVTRFVIPNGTVIPARGHFLGVNTAGYSIGAYPAGNGTTATGDATYTLDIPDLSGIALFSTSNPANFTDGRRLDAVGYSVNPPFYREGAGFTPLNSPTGVSEANGNYQYSFYRDLSAGLPKDTGNNTADFVGVETFGYPTSAGQRLGAPGPENLSSPIQRNGQIQFSLIDPAQLASAPPNRVSTPGPFTYVDPSSRITSTFPAGSLSIRRVITNNTGGPVTRLRFRLVDVTTLPAPAGTADLRALTSGMVQDVRLDGSTVTVQGTTLETPPMYRAGGGYNHSLSVTLPAPLPAGQSMNIQFLCGVRQGGSFRFLVNTELLP